MWVCNSCGHSINTRAEMCAKCKKTGTFVKQSAIVAKPLAAVNQTPLGLASYFGGQFAKPLRDIEITSEDRLATGLGEFDRVIGGGLVGGVEIIIGGEPGIGKSTLITLIADSIVKATGGNVLYVSAEETAPQTKKRTNRMEVDVDGIYALYELDIDRILSTHVQSVPDLRLLIIDSLNTVMTTKEESSPGDARQMKYCEAAIRAYTKSSGVPVIIIGQVTKEGVIAGSQALIHQVDVALYLEGDKNSPIRILRASKSRIGSTEEIGIFRMEETGLVQVSDIDRAFTSFRRDDDCGCATSVIMEGNRPILVDMEALVISSSAANPLRKTVGFNRDTLSMILASIERHVDLGFPDDSAIVTDKEIYVNSPSNVLVEERILDLAVAMAVVSSILGLPIPSDWVILGEIRLTGGVIGSLNMTRRISEAKRLGYNRFLVPAGVIDKMGKNRPDGVAIFEVENLQDAILILFPQQFQS